MNYIIQYIKFYYFHTTLKIYNKFINFFLKILTLKFF